MKLIFSSGEHPELGYYVCANCQNADSPIAITDEEAILPVCPNCGGIHWIKAL